MSNDYTYNTSNHYPVPLFNLTEFDGDTADTPAKGGVLNVNLIVELPSYPVVNETVEERILLSNGGTL